jgi:hypothetical protein
MTQFLVFPLAGSPLPSPLATCNSLFLLNPSYLLGIPPLVWCDPVHPGPRLLVNWPPPPHSNFQTPRGFPKSIVCLTKTTSRSRLHIVRNTPLVMSLSPHSHTFVACLIRLQSCTVHDLCSWAIVRNSNSGSVVVVKTLVNTGRTHKKSGTFVVISRTASLYKKQEHFLTVAHSSEQGSNRKNNRTLVETKEHSHKTEGRS